MCKKGWYPVGTFTWEFFCIRYSNYMRKIGKYSLITCAILAISVFTSCTKTKVEVVNSPSVQAAPKNKPVVKVFLENSGSMDGFMCDGSQLKDGIYNYLTNVKDNASKMELYYINSKTIKQDVPLSDYIRDLNPSAFQKAGGNRAFTDIPNLFKRVLSSVDENTIAVYISDCILDIPNHAAPKFLHITQTDMHSVFGDKIAKQKNLAVCIYQLESTFSGTFFFPKGGSQKYNGKLPYYMFVIGSNSQLANLRKKVSESQITHGVKNYCAFSPSYDAPTTLLQGNKPAKSLELNTQRDGRFKFKVQSDLSLSLQNDNILTADSNYTMSNPNDLAIESISPITSEGSDYSHIIEFSIVDKVFGSVVTINRISMPNWIKQSNDNDGNSVAPSKTFGIEFILGGISDAYLDKKTASFKLNIKKQ